MDRTFSNYKQNCFIIQLRLLLKSFMDSWILWPCLLTWFLKTDTGSGNLFPNFHVFSTLARESIELRVFSLFWDIFLACWQYETVPRNLINHSWTQTHSLASWSINLYCLVSGSTINHCLAISKSIYNSLLSLASGSYIYHCLPSGSTFYHYLPSCSNNHYCLESDSTIYNCLASGGTITQCLSIGGFMYHILVDGRNIFHYLSLCGK